MGETPNRLIRRRVALVVTLVSALLATLPAAPAGAYHADRQRELNRLIAEKEEQIRQAEARERSLLSQINESDARRLQLERELALITDELAQAQARLALIEERLTKVSVELRVKTLELENTLADLADQTAVLNGHVQHLYMDASAGLVAALRAAENFDDFVAANEYQSSIVRANQDAVARIEETKALIETQRADIEAQKASLEEDRKTADAETARIGQIRASRASARAAVANEIAHRESLLAQVRDQKRAYERAVESYRSESRSIADFLRGAQRGQRAIQGRGGYLKWPVSGSITSPYGWRTHPVYGYRSFHSGIDIGAGMGTTVRAARKGTVIYTGWRGAYGLVVILDHGNALATMYAHLSKTYVRTGERVSTQESVAAVGSTGWSTGPHLHFEVRVNGEPQNPMRWL